MAHHINWYIENRIIYFHVYGDVSQDELTEINAQIVALLEEGQPPVHLVVNDADVDKMPINIREVSRNLTFMTHPNIGMALAIGEVNAIVRFIVPVIAKIAGINFIRRHTIAEALEYIKSYDTKIDLTSADDSILQVN